MDRNLVLCGIAHAFIINDVNKLSMAIAMFQQRLSVAEVITHDQTKRINRILG